MKKVLLMLVDALTARFLTSELEKGAYPNLRQLREAGHLQESISIFPSITHAALSSLATGVYPKDHGVLGSYWYQSEIDEVTYLGSSPQIIWNEGIGDFYRDFMVRLNHQRLHAPTIFQQVEEQGLHATCINHLIFRGDQKHQVEPPLIIKLVPDIPLNDELAVMGPQALFLGGFVNDTAVSDDEISFLDAGPQNWFGYKDDTAFRLLLQLAKQDALKDFTLAYFPENDFVCHEQGPESAHQKLDTFDEKLGELFAAYGGLEAMLSEFTVMITGDHGQCKIEADDSAIDIAQILDTYQCVTAGRAWQPGDEVMICVNLRAATLYFSKPERDVVQDVVEKLRSVSTIDQVICQAHWLDPGLEGYMVLSERGDLRFWHGGEATDAYGNEWGWEGALAAVDGRCQNNFLRFHDYPNAFERLVGVLESEDTGPIWVTAVPGYEFSIPGMGTYAGGGNHGSLHRLDSLSPLITAGLPASVSRPDQPRLVDIAPFCRSILTP